MRLICVNMRVCEPGLGGVEAAVLRLHEEGEGRSVLRVGQARVLPEGGHQVGQRGAQQQRQGEGAAEEVQAVLPIPGLHVSVRHAPCQVAEQCGHTMALAFLCAQFTEVNLRSGYKKTYHAL